MIKNILESEVVGVKRVIVDICNSLLTTSIVNALRNTGNFEVYSTKCGQARKCNWTAADVALLEAAYNPGFTINESLAKAAKLHQEMSQCKIILLCDETSAPELAKKIPEFKRDGLIDDFIYSSVSETYLLAMLEAM